MHIVDNEEGFVLVLSLMVLVILTIIGFATTTDTIFELQITGNERLHKKTFYEAEGGAMLATEILEQAFYCTSGFKETDAANGWADLAGSPTDFIRIYKRGDVGSEEYVLWNNPYPLLSDVTDITKADVAYPIANLDPDNDGNSDDDLPGTGYLYFGGETEMLPGGALQMAAGYEGKGKSAGQGGVAKMYDIYSVFKEISNSEAIILFGWRHLVGTAGTPSGDYCQ